ncbi:MAG: hypothetical protein ACI4T5_04415, partial [Prevotella sp.]
MCKFAALLLNMDAMRSFFPNYKVERNALQGQRAHSPGQSEATPWVRMPRMWERPERAKALFTAAITLLPLQGVYRNTITNPGRCPGLCA